MTSAERLVLLAVEQRRGWPSVQQLATDTGLSQREVLDTLERLTAGAGAL